MNEYSNLSYEGLLSLVEEAALVTDVAEVHGLLCALGTHRDWQAQLQLNLAEEPPLSESWFSRLTPYYESAQTALNGGDMEFALLLPAGDTALEVRTDALGAWCRGFVLGLASSGIRSDEHLSDEAKEALMDLIVIQEAAADGGGEEEERAYVEIVEYVRICAQLLHDELSQQA